MQGPASPFRDEKEGSLSEVEAPPCWYSLSRSRPSDTSKRFPLGNYSRSVCSHMAGCRLNLGDHLTVKVRRPGHGYGQLVQFDSSLTVHVNRHRSPTTTVRQRQLTMPSSLSAVGNDGCLWVVLPFNEMAVNFTRERWKPGLIFKWNDLVEFLFFGASASPI